MIDTVINFFKDHTFNIIIILLAGYILRRFAMVFVRKLVRRAIKNNHFKTEQDEKQREDTMTSTIGAGLRVTIWIVFGLLLLGELGIDIAPLLAGAGIAGVALGFGAQAMVKDFLAGLFILIENQYRVGDVIEINQTVSGKVEQVTLRTTVLRDLDGMVHHIANGTIFIATNMTMEFANVNLDISVSYDTDIEKLEKVVNDVGEKLANDELWKEFIFTQPKFLRVDDFAASAIIIKITGEVAPMMQWKITGELRKRLKIAFDKSGISIPFPQMVIHEQDNRKTTKK